MNTSSRGGRWVMQQISHWLRSLNGSGIIVNQAVVVEKRFEHCFYGEMWFGLWCGYSTFMGKCDSAYGVVTPLLWGNVIQLMVWLFHFYGEMWFSLWCGYYTFMGKCDSAYGVATPLLWRNVIQLMVWLLHFYGEMWFSLWCGYSTFMGKTQKGFLQLCTSN
jgi:hypothetical protein